MRRSRFLIRLAGLLVPAGQREEWSREWFAELRHADAHGRHDPPALLRFAWGAFSDAAWFRRARWDRDALARTQSARSCLTGLVAVILLIIIASGFLPITRSILMPLPYREPERIATASLGTALAARFPLHAQSAYLWRSKSKLLEAVEVYLWKDALATDPSGRERRIVSARVSEGFFSLLGARSAEGRIFGRNQLANCLDCVVLSYTFWRDALDGKPLTPETRVLLDGRRYRVAGVLEKNFWFLSRQISVWPVAPLASFGAERTGVVARLGPGVSPAEAEREMNVLLRQAGLGNGRDGQVQLAPVVSRVRSVFGSFSLALILAIVTVAASSRLRLPKTSLRGAVFFVVKTLLLLTAVFLAGVEFTHAPLITMLGGADLLAEPLSTWLFLLGCMGVVLWSLRDQQARCPVCLRRLGLPTRVGCPGCLLLDWAGTEFVCVEGHGMLHIPEMVSSWSKPDRWTSLDDSWQALFERS